MSRTAARAATFATFAVLVILFAVSPSRIAAQQGDAVTARGERVLAYWTESRMRAASPRDVLLADLPGKDRARVGAGPESSAGTAPASGSWTAGGAIAARSGKVFFTLDATDYVCSASAIDDDGDADYSLVMTAAHCVYDEEVDVFATQWIYVPDWDAAPTYDCATVAHDCWLAQALVIHAGWADEESLTLAAVKHDYAVAVVGAGVLDSGQLDDLGSYPVRIGPVPVGGAADIFGYPAAPPFQGDDLTYCSGTVSLSTSDGWGMTCNMTGGASGGPWLYGSTDPADGSGSLASVSSYRIQGDPGLYGPELDGATRAVINAAKSLTPDGTGIDTLIVSGSVSTGATYVPLDPARLLDTRVDKGLEDPFKTGVVQSFQV
ncbi:MAG: trypsin-like peptidase domain-containing protein, partial [Chloroflexota bacterium]|nr:trypsin-like peptidase domain-containing protein [Chloroflexota bacterium]